MSHHSDEQLRYLKRTIGAQIPLTDFEGQAILDDLIAARAALAAIEKCLGGTTLAELLTVEFKIRSILHDVGMDETRRAGGEAMSNDKPTCPECGSRYVRQEPWSTPWKGTYACLAPKCGCHFVIIENEKPEVKP